MPRPKLRMLDPGAGGARAVVLGATVRTLGAAPVVKATVAFYGSAEWKALLRQIIKARGRRCQDVNCKTPHRGEGRRIYGDHDTELRDGGAPLDERNVVLRCAACHGRKTAAAREARAGREAKAGGAVSKTGWGASTAGGSSLESAPNAATFFPSRGGR